MDDLGIPSYGTFVEFDQGLLFLAPLAKQPLTAVVSEFKVAPDLMVHEKREMHVL